MNTIGDRIKQERIKLNLTQEMLAQKLNVTRSVVANWEINRVVPDALEINELANLFNVCSDYILGRSDKSQTINLQNADSTLKNIVYKIPLLDDDSKNALGEYVDYLLYQTEKKEKQKEDKK